MNAETFISCLAGTHLRVPEYLSCLLSKILQQHPVAWGKSSNCSHTLPSMLECLCRNFCLKQSRWLFLVSLSHVIVTSYQLRRFQSQRCLLQQKNVIKYTSVDFYLKQGNKHTRDSSKTILRAFKTLLSFKVHKPFPLSGQTQKSLRY